MADATVFISSDWVIMNRLRRTAPEIPRAYLVETADGFADALDRAAIDENAMLDIEIGLALAHPELVREARGAGVEVAAWTVDESDQATSALEMGISRITTNQVEKLLAWRFDLT
jgi:glycerophosphoryl diester phosphodiesterase